MYILECADGTYYTGSTIDLERRFEQHQNGEGANYTKKRIPVKLVYVEEFNRIDEAFYREKQVQGWSRAKKEALIDNNPGLLPDLSECKNDSHFSNADFDSAQSAGGGSQSAGGGSQSAGVSSLSGVEMNDAQSAGLRSLSGAEMNDRI